jgi:hypothetical protein
MFPMTPEDMYRQVARHHDEERKRVARERMAMAASAPRGTKHSAARSASGSRLHNLSHDLSLTARHLLGALAVGHGVAHQR